MITLAFTTKVNKIWDSPATWNIPNVWTTSRWCSSLFHNPYWKDLRRLRFSNAVESCRPFTMVAMMPIRRGPPDELRLATVNPHTRDIRIVVIEHDHRYLLDGTVQFPISVSGVKGIRLTSVTHSRPLVTRHRCLKTSFEFCWLQWFPFHYICYRELLTIQSTAFN